MKDLGAKIIASSADPKQLSLLIRAQLLLIAPLFSLLVKAGGGAVDNNEVEAIINGITDAVYFIGMGAWAVSTVYAGGRRLYNSLIKK